MPKIEPDNPSKTKRIQFTKMQGAGNDFVVLDETQASLGLTPAQYRFLADRHFGVGADQILTVRAAPNAEVDFEYVIHNADGGQVEQCGNGSRCFVRYVVDKGLTNKQRIKVQTLGGVLEPRLAEGGDVTVDMGKPVFDLPAIPFDSTGLTSVPAGSTHLWQFPLSLLDRDATYSVAVVSMGNPHAVLTVDDVDTTPVQGLGPAVQAQGAFPKGVNVGFLQVQSRSSVRLRVYERGTGETLACGSGACAAVVAGIQQGMLDNVVDVHTRGGRLRIEWAGAGASVMMTGPAVTVFEGVIEIPEQL
jgi:diaminopimelate epimerase